MHVLPSSDVGCDIKNQTQCITINFHTVRIYNTGPASILRRGWKPPSSGLTSQDGCTSNRTFFGPISSEGGYCSFVFVSENHFADIRFTVFKFGFGNVPGIEYNWEKYLCYVVYRQEYFGDSLVDDAFHDVIAYSGFPFSATKVVVLAYLREGPAG